MDNLSLNRENGQKLWAADWNKLVSTINLIIDVINNDLLGTAITKLSQLINDTEFITLSDISGKADKNELAQVAISGSYNDLTDTPEAIGTAGKSAYELAVDNGFEGTEQLWLASLKGENGSNGQDGTNGLDGAPGQDGITPHIDSTTKHWMIGETDTNVVAEGNDGHSPVISASKNSGVTTITSDGTTIATINDGHDGTNGTNGSDGITPHIDSTTGNWFIGNTDTGVHAQGPAGLDGIVTGSQAQADWNLTDNTSVDYIKNKPTIPAAQILSDWNQSDNTAKDYIKNKPSLFSGNYNDLSNKPTIPDSQIQSDWNLTDNTAKDFIKNKPTIPTVPTNVSDFNNDADYIQKSSTSGLLKNDGTVDTNTYLTQHLSLSDYVLKSLTAGLLKNDGTVDTNTYLTLHLSLSNYVEKSQTAGLLKNDGTVDTNTYLTSAPVTSVNGQTGAVTLTIPSTTGMVTSSTTGLKIEVVAALPASPNANTIYLVL